MLDVEERLSWLADSVQDKLSFLEGSGYERSAPKFQNMQATGRFVPDMPYMEAEWVNDAAHRRISVIAFRNYAVFCSVKNTSSGRSFDMKDYFKWKYGKDIGTHSMAGENVEIKFLSFLQRIGDELRADILTGEDLPNVPFDWQGQK
jgi:hypothetical protein